MSSVRLFSPEHTRSRLLRYSPTAKQAHSPHLCTQSTTNTSDMVHLWRTAPAPARLPSDMMEVYLSERPETEITSTTFSTRHVTLPPASTLGASDVIVKVLYVSCDPAMRVWLSRTRSYMAPVEEGTRMRALGVGRVVRTGGSECKIGVGEVVSGMFGWGNYAIVGADKVTRERVPGGLPMSVMLGVLGITGMTAYFGLVHVGKVKRGECVVVSAAAGATGSVVCEIAKNVFGCETIGIAGGEGKCRYLREDLGVVSVDYKAEGGVEKGLKEALGGRRIDVYFDNVGGDTLVAALRRINFGARVVVCGAISGYNRKGLQAGPYNYVNIISYRARMEGFLLRDFEEEFEKAKIRLGKWLKEGKLSFREDVVVGLENAPEGLRRLFQGKNIGKVVVKVLHDEDGVSKEVGGNARAAKL